MRGEGFAGACATVAASGCADFDGVGFNAVCAPAGGWGFTAPVWTVTPPVWSVTPPLCGGALFDAWLAGLASGAFEWNNPSAIPIMKSALTAAAPVRTARKGGFIRRQKLIGTCGAFAPPCFMAEGAGAEETTGAASCSRSSLEFSQ